MWPRHEIGLEGTYLAYFPFSPMIERSQMTRYHNKLLVVVGLILQNSKCTVELLSKDGTHYLVREGHLREREFAICSLVDSVAKAIRASDNEDKTLGARRHSALEHISKLNRAELGTMLVEEHEVVGVADELKYLLALETFLLGLREFAGVAHVSKRGYRKLYIVV